VLTIALLRLAATTGEAAGEKAAEPSNPVIPDLSEVVWAAICFFLLLLLVYTVLLPTLRRLMTERDAKIRGDRDAAERTRDSLVSTRADYDAALADARLEANRLIEGARAEAEAHRVTLQAEADREIAGLRQVAQQEIATARASAVTRVRGDVVDLAVGAASAVMQRPIERSGASAIVDRVLSN
jgi:F-type H+-transporting ATPase subunit b